MERPGIESSMERFQECLRAVSSGGVLWLAVTVLSMR